MWWYTRLENPRCHPCSIHVESLMPDVSVHPKGGGSPRFNVQESEIHKNFVYPPTVQGKKPINVTVVSESWDASKWCSRPLRVHVLLKELWVGKNKLSHLWPEVSRSANSRIHTFGGPRCHRQNDALASAVKFGWNIWRVCFFWGKDGEELDTCPFCS